MKTSEWEKSKLKARQKNEYFKSLNWCRVECLHENRWWSENENALFNVAFFNQTLGGASRIKLHLLLIQLSRWSDFRHETANAVLKLAVLGGVDERIDAAVRLEQNDGDVVEPDSSRTRLSPASWLHAMQLSTSMQWVETSTPQRTIVFSP